MGTPDFAVPSLEALIEKGYEVIGVVTQPDRPKGRKKVLTATPVKEAALKFNLPVLQPEKLKGSPELEQIKAWKPDLVVTAAFGQLLPKEMLELPPFRCINVHASLLPKYRGGAPIHKAIIDGEEKTGVTIMYMAEKLDAGDVLTQVSIPIGETDDVASMFEKLSVVGAQLLIDTLPLLAEGKLEPIAQDESQVTYAPNIKREEEEIDWHKNGKDIYNHVRGLCPFPVAYTKVNGEVLKVWSAKKTTDSYRHKEPGTVYRLDQEGLGVISGDGTGILLTEIQPSGKKKMNASDFLRGTGSKWSIDMKLGV